MKLASPLSWPPVLRQAWYSLWLAGLAIVGMGGISMTPPTSSDLLLRLGFWPTDARGPARDVALSGPYAYVAAGEGGLLVLDVTDPTRPVRVGGYVPPGRTEFVQVVGSKAYLGTQVHRGGGCQTDDGRGQLVILDVSDPTKPVPLGTYMSSTAIQSFLVAGDRAFIGNIGPEQQEFRIVDVHDPAHPVVMDVTPNFTARALSASGGFVYFGVFSEIRAMDATQANLGNVSDATDAQVGRIRGVQAVGDRLYVVGGDTGSEGGLSIFNISTPTHPTLLGQMRFGDTPMGIAAAGNYLYLGMLKTGLVVVDVNDPTKPVAAATTEAPGVPVRVSASGQKVFVAGFHGGLHIFDVQDPTRPVRLAMIDTGLTARRGLVTGSRAYLLSADSFFTYAAEYSADNPGRSRLEILDLSDRAHPSLLGSYEVPSAMTSLDVAGHLVFLVGPGAALEVLDCQDPAHPVQVSKTPVALSAEPSDSPTVQVQSPYAYISSANGSGLLVYDVNDPAKPVQAGTLSAYATALQVQGTRVYLNSGYQLTLADVANPRDPQNLGSIYLPSGTGTAALAVGHDFVCAGQGWYGFSLIDLSDPANPAVLGTYDTVGEVRDLRLDGANAFVAEGWKGIEVFDLGQPAQPVPVDQTPTLGQARMVQVADGFAYVVEGGRGLAVFSLPTSSVTLLEHPCDAKAPCGGTASLNVRAFGHGTLSYQWYAGESGDVGFPVLGATNASLTTSVSTGPAAYWVRVQNSSGKADSRTAYVRPLPSVSLDLLGLWPGWRRGPVADVDVAGKLAFLAVGNAGLWICDIVDPAPPKVLARYPTKAYASGVAVAGEYAFVAAGGLLLFDVSNPARPIQIGELELPAYGNRVVLSGQYLYVSGSELSIVDVSNLAAPQLVGTFQPHDNGFNGNVLAVAGSYVCIADAGYDNMSFGDLIVLDVSNPSTPKELSSYRITGGISSVALLGNHAYVLNSSYYSGSQVAARLRVFDLSNPAQPSPTANLDFTQNDRPNHICIRETLAYVSDSQSGLIIFDISSPSQPKRIANLTEALYGMSSLCLSGTRAYGGLGDNGLAILDVGQATSPKRLGHLETGGFAQQLAIAGNSVFLAEGTAGLRILDVSDPTTPQSRALSQASGSATCATAAGTTVFFGGDLLAVLDSTAPLESRSVPDSSMVTHLSASGQSLYAVDSSQFRVLNLANPANPTVVGTRDLYGFGDNKCVIPGPEGFALVGREWEGLLVLDVRTPTAPKLSAAYYADSPVWDVAVRDHTALLTLGPDLPGLDVVDVTDILRPARLNRINLPLANSVAWCGPYACVTGQELTILDMTDPTNPVRVASHSLGAEMRGLQVIGNRIYVAAGEYGLAVYQFSSPLALDPPVRTASAVQISWPGAPSLRLQQTSSLLHPDWHDVEATAGASQVQVAPTNTSGFYRLVRSPAE